MTNRRQLSLLLCCAVALPACGQWSNAQDVPTTVAASTTTVVQRGISESGQRSGPSTMASQRKLLQLGFWLLNPNGTFDDTTRQAVMAFQKYFQLRPTGTINAATAFLLERMDMPATANEKTKTLAEVDKTRQLLFLVQDGITTHVLNASTGDDREYTEPDSNTPGVIITDTAITPVGTFRINRERPDGWWMGDLGQIYRPKYFIGGVAIHGSLSVPAYPASHGCVRVSVAAMDMIWENEMLPRGTTVVVYGEIS
jgi:peptidoglycan hydrolase-like protein with peptidoglycan-binding domain